MRYEGASLRGLRFSSAEAAPPVGLKKPFPIFIHETAMLFDYIYVSAGQRGLQLKIAPTDLVKAVNATVVPIAEPKPEA